ncbi:hypothetical protein GXW82_16105 [Streptacidiphilus sp. 4-A2]|nr:hypothetical protein [Streptacidiphilus sp. 4-A2]
MTPPPARTPARTRSRRYRATLAAAAPWPPRPPACCSPPAPPGAAAPQPRTAAATPAQYPDLAPTPPMGWNDWSYYQCGENEQIVLANARALVSSGLAAKGYRTVTIDDCWMAPSRDAAGNLVADPAKFPDGMAYVGAQLHKMGLKFGIYEDAGTQTCGGFPGSMDHWQQDADLFAKWGVDYVKLDGCNVPTPSGETDEQAYYATYSAMSQALLHSGRKMVFSISAPAYFEGEPAWDSVITWSAQLGNLWREGDDIALGQESGDAKWSSILDNYGYNVGLAGLQRPGRWNDPDFLLAGDSGLTQDELQSQVSLWAMMAAPMISSTDLTKLSPGALAALGNKDIIAVDQDRLGVQGRIVQQGSGYAVLSKPLAGGDRAVALFNSSDSAQTVTTTARKAGFAKGTSFRLENLVSKAVTQTTGTIAADVPPHATVIYRVSADGSVRGLQPATALSWQNISTAAQPDRYLVALSDHGSTGITGVRLSVAAPKGWKVTPASTRLADLRPGATGYAVVSLEAPKAVPGTTVTAITATAGYRTASAGAGRVSGQQTITSVVPYPTLAAAFNNVGVTSESAPARATSTRPATATRPRPWPPPGSPPAPRSAPTASASAGPPPPRAPRTMSPPPVRGSPSAAAAAVWRSSARRPAPSPPRSW